jgi:hypothetical protein
MRRVRTSLACGLVLAAAPVLAASPAEKPECAAVMNSGLAEPDWFLSECLGGVAPRAATRLVPVPWRLPFGTDLAFVHNFRAAGPFPNSLTTTPVGSLTYTNVGTVGRPIFAADFDKPATTLWGIDNATRELGTYNLATGAFTPTGLVTGIAVGENIEALKFDPTSTNVYVQTTNGTVSNLYTIDLNTRAATLVGPIGFPLVITMAISASGQMYGRDNGTDVLISIDKTTGAGTLIGPLGIDATFAQGMDFDNSTNILWAWIYQGAGVNQLSTINLQTGAQTLIVTGVNGPENQGAIRVPLVAALAPAALAVDDAGNDVMEPGEAAAMAPSWRNDNSAAASATGALSAFTGPAGGTYTINDGAAAYTIGANSTASCGADCYSLTASASSRPAAHWDASVLETLSTGATKTWTLHLGQSFTDVSTGSGFYRFIETLLHRGITGGCAADQYCPANATTREQMSAFVLVAKEGAGYNPPACVAPNLFIDVPDTSPFCKFIEELANRGVVTGCGPGLYCPQSPVTREQMAIFVLRTLDPALNPPACGTPMFNDVPASSAFCRWIEELARRGVVTGCGGGNYCPTSAVTREQMGVFLSLTFGLTLYGV